MVMAAMRAERQSNSAHISTRRMSAAAISMTIVRLSIVSI